MTETFSKPAIRGVFAGLTLAILALVLPISARADRYGPFDYYNPPKGSRALVEIAHFGAKTMERAHRGDWCWYWSDLDYTLHAFPNHPRALEAMAEFLDHHQPCMKRRDGADLHDILTEIDEGDWKQRTADFYYKAGIKFRPKQPMVHFLYGRYLYRKGRVNEALEQLLTANKLRPNSRDTQYYLGLAYVEMGDYPKARTYAHQAYRLGAKQPDLREKLVAAGAWKN